MAAVPGIKHHNRFFAADTGRGGNRRRYCCLLRFFCRRLYLGIFLFFCWLKINGSFLLSRLAPDFSRRRRFLPGF